MQKRNMVLHTYGAEICLVLARWENLLYLLLCFPTVGDRLEASALHRGAAGGPSYACALREADSKGRFQISPFLALYIPCLDG